MGRERWHRLVMSVCVWLGVLAGGAAASEAPAAAAGAPSEGSEHLQMRADEQGHLIIEDNVDLYSLSLPGRYWKCRTANQLVADAGQQGGGCAPAGGVPPGLLLVAQNRDAPAVMTLELMPKRFLMRSRDDLEKYVNGRHEMIRQRGGAGVEPGPASCSESHGMILARAVFTASGRGQKQNYLLVLHFVRPQGEDARLYQLACIAPEEDFGWLSEDFEHIIASFRFTGTASAEFFAPDAPAEKLPSVEEASAGAGCGRGYAGMILASAVVFAVYLLVRRRLSRPQI